MGKIYVKTGLLIFLALLCASCGGTKLIRGEVPMVRMNELSHGADGISVQLSMRNLNGVELDVRDIDFKLSVKDDVLFSYTGPVDTKIVANGTEVWGVQIEESDHSRTLLNSLENGEVKSLSYSLDGSIGTREDGKLRFSHSGHLYPVPGRPGKFR